MSAEDFALVREALAFSCDPISEAIGEGCGRCAGCEGYAALARLEARLAEVERERDMARDNYRTNDETYLHMEKVFRARAEAAEARLAEVERERDEAGMLPEEGLERIASLACDLLAALRPWEMHGPTVRSSAARLTIALAALPLQAAPKQDEAEGEK